MTSSIDAELATATEQGRICALAAGGQRDLQRCVAAHRELFSGRPFDAALFSNVALATAFGAPWCTTEQLRIANRTALWVFAADWLIDYRATARGEIDVLVERCLAVADGARPSEDDQLGRFLAEIRDELAAAPAFTARRPAWREELRRMLMAMAQEWTWKAVRADTTAADPTVGSPTFAEYLDNADNFGSSWVNVSHWLFLGDQDSLDHLAELTVASRAVQRVLRLVNDLATHRRDLDWGDLSALVLGVDRDEVTRRIAMLVKHCRELLRPLEDVCPQEARYLARQIGFSTGFYRLTDFWGSL